jgi:hypothetical protein
MWGRRGLFRASPAVWLSHFVSLFSYSQVSSGVAGARRILELINTETELDQNQAGYRTLRGACGIPGRHLFL